MTDRDFTNSMICQGKMEEGEENSQEKVEKESREREEHLQMTSYSKDDYCLEIILFCSRAIQDFKGSKDLAKTTLPTSLPIFFSYKSFDVIRESARKGFKV